MIGAGELDLSACLKRRLNRCEREPLDYSLGAIARLDSGLFAGAASLAQQRGGSVGALLVGVNGYNQLELSGILLRGHAGLRDQLVANGFPTGHIV